MSALICGSVAFDSIMVFKDHFANHILPDKVHMLSVSFMVPEMRKEYGGCAGNIAYNLQLLGGDPLPMATVGSDFAPYGAWMDECGINRRHVSIIDTEYTAQAFITTDLGDNQITAFHPGAMSMAHVNDVADAEGVDIGIIAPDGRDGMIAHADQFADNDIPFIFDPGQQLPMFSGEELMRFLERCTYLTVNDYEWSMIQDKTELTETKVAEMIEALVVTRGADGASIYTPKGTFDIPAAPASDLTDPTGCGDAHRAGLLYGLANGMDWETTGRIASLLGAIKIERGGTQNHTFDRDSFAARYSEAFGRSLDWV
jgi:adenosine kinase